MLRFLPTIILRHRKENLKKCSLHGLESHPNIQFFTYPISSLPSIENYITLDINAPPLSPLDSHYGLFIIDGTWKYAHTMTAFIEKSQKLLKRSIPPIFMTAYPRKQTGCSNPQKGLASIEALYIANRILGRHEETLLNHYYWKEPFLELNKKAFDALSF